MAYTIGQIEQIAAKLRKLPRMERQLRPLNQREAVARLAKEIKRMQQKGYTLEQVTDILRGQNLDVTTPALRVYLQRARGPKKEVATPVHELNPTPPAETIPVANPPTIPDNSSSDTEGN